MQQACIPEQHSVADNLREFPSICDFANFHVFRWKDSIGNGILYLHWFVNLIALSNNFCCNLCLPVRERKYGTNADFIWSHILRNVQQVLLWTANSVFRNFMEHFLFELLLVWTLLQPQTDYLIDQLLVGFNSILKILKYSAKSFSKPNGVFKRFYCIWMTFVDGEAWSSAIQGQVSHFLPPNSSLIPT
jgi:hypothetical protein